ncbi:MAG TPA: nitrile hydratase subunit beta [Chloroflexota bacterium]|nr:nitrile hydratase subunit beta [Chloroflexota bacterium]
MNGIHAMGGMHGFGPVEREDAEPVFHAPWEARVFAMALEAPFGIRRLIEAIPPAQYLAFPYYERWLAAIEAGLIGGGTLTAEEIDERAAFFAAHPEAPVSRREDPPRAEDAVVELHQQEPVRIDAEVSLRFAVGDALRARNVHPAGHTRLPRYVRGRRGVIARYYGVHAFPDTQRYGAPEGPQPVYSVRLESGELWGDDGAPRTAVYVDLWESHLEAA